MLSEEISVLLNKDPVLHNNGLEGFYLSFFLVPKKGCSNKHLIPVLHVSTYLKREVLHVHGGWSTNIDLQ